MRTALSLLAMSTAIWSCACASTPLQLRLLSSEPPAVLPATPSDAPACAPQQQAPRIGAPGGSGAGSRRVTPLQSGNDTCGFRPVGMGGGIGRDARG